MGSGRAVVEGELGELGVLVLIGVGAIAVALAESAEDIDRAIVNRLEDQQASLESRIDIRR